MNSVVTEQKTAPVAAGWVLVAVAWLCFLIPFPGLGIFGWVLNFVAFIIAIVVIAKGRTLPGIVQIAATVIASPIVYFIGLAIFAAVVTGSAESARVATEQATEQKMAEGPVEAVSARDLFAAYETNEVAADQRFKGKVIEVTGRIEGIDQDFSDQPLVRLDSGDMIRSVQAGGLDASIAATLSKGSEVTLVCIGAGEVVGTPRLDECRVSP